MVNPLISIVIPIYNGAWCVGRCLDSIYSQGLRLEDFEVICVDDCSTDGTLQVLAEYAARYQNLTICKHSVNKCIGGGRNTGISISKGEYIAFIDCDDYFEAGTLCRVVDALKSNRSLDLLMYDISMFNISTNRKLGSNFYRRNSQEVMSGRQFMKTQEVPWAAWNYVYRRNFLLNKNIAFVEHVRWEDADFTLYSVVQAERVKYIPVAVLCHTENDSQTSRMGGNRNVLLDMFRLIGRVRRVGMAELAQDAESGEAIMKIHNYMYKSRVQRYLWRLPVKDIFKVLKECRPYTPSSDKFVAFCARHPVVFGCSVVAGKPFFPLLRKLYLMRKGR